MFPAENGINSKKIYDRAYPKRKANNALDGVNLKAKIGPNVPMRIVRNRAASA